MVVVAERMTLDEHVEHAQRMVVAGTENYVEARDAEERDRARDMLFGALVHATIAVALGQQLATPPVGPTWTWAGDQLVLKLRGDTWRLEFFGEVEGGPDGENHGWFLFGPSLPNGYWTCYETAGAQAHADRVIGVYYANFTPERFGGQFGTES